MRKVLKVFLPAVLLLLIVALIPAKNADAKRRLLNGDQFFQYSYDFEKNLDLPKVYMSPYVDTDYYLSVVGYLGRDRLPLYIDGNGSFVAGFYFGINDENALPDDGEREEFAPVSDTEIKWYEYEIDYSSIDDGTAPGKEIEVTSEYLGEVNNENAEIKVKVYRFTLPKTYFDPAKIYSEDEKEILVEVTKAGKSDSMQLSLMNSPLTISENEDGSNGTRGCASLTLEDGESKAFYINNLFYGNVDVSFEPSKYPQDGPSYYVITKDKMITDFTELKKYIKIEEVKPYSKYNEPKDNLFKITLYAADEPYVVHVPWAVYYTEVQAATYYGDTTKFYVSPQKSTCIEEVPATCEKPGCKAYYKKGNKYFSDKDLKNEIKDIEAWKKGDGLIKATGHKWVKPTLKKAKYCKTCGKVEGYPLFKVDKLTYNITKKSGKTGRVEVYAIKNTVKKITIPRTVTYKNVKYEIKAIADGAFKNNKKLEEINLGKRTYTIGEEAFKNCTNLKKVEVDFSVRDIKKSAFEGCKKLTTVTFGKMTKSIGDKAFAGCTSLKEVTLPSNIKSIGADAFKGDKSLKSITIKSKKLKTVGKNAFKSINKKATVKVPSSKKKAYTKLLKDAGIGKKQVK